MPFNPNNPETKRVKHSTELDKVITHYNIEAFRVQLDRADPDKNMVHILWSMNYVEDGVLIKESEKRSVVIGAPLNAVAAGPVDPALTMYDNLKYNLWQLLIDAGEVPAGSVV